MSDIGLIVAVGGFLLHAFVRHGGGWFETLSCESRYSNSVSNFEFRAFGYLLMFAAFFGIIFVCGNLAPSSQMPTYAESTALPAHKSVKASAHASVKKHPAHTQTVAHHAQSGKH
ncbi:MAG: hypothetical protein IAF58_08555 [Leptolyngbya sp.]|nr:hypothetical protein [Candidatus Melainabacteria bacterium]